MAKTKYIAVDPDGGEHNRSTDRTYTHAVLVYSLSWQQDRDYLIRTIEYISGWDVEKSPHKTSRLAELQAALDACTGQRTWGCYGFCGRHDLAVKTAAKVQKARKDGDRVEIVEAVQQ